MRNWIIVIVALLLALTILSAGLLGAAGYCTAKRRYLKDDEFLHSALQSEWEGDGRLRFNKSKISMPSLTKELQHWWHSPEKKVFLEYLFA